MKSYSRFLMIAFGFLFLVNCHQKHKLTIKDADILHHNEDQLTQVIIYDIFTPPVAARIYAYSSLASYEAIRFAKPGNPSLAEKLNGFGVMPQPEKGKKYDYTLAATKAFFTVVRDVKVFSVDSLKNYEETMYSLYKDALDEETYQASLSFGEAIGRKILARAAVDNYPQSRGKPRFIGSNEPGKWHPTPPDYLDGVESCWGTMKTFAIDTGSQFMIPPPPPFSTDTTSIFYRANIEVYNINKNLTAEQKTIARYWDDNPFVIEHSGHMMFGNKKITPGGHWMGITAIACKQTDADAVKTAKAYALTAIGLFDAFVACWDEKYRSDFIRPVSFIDENIDHGWVPFLQTPPFPEYPSGHSAITRSAATILTHLFGDNFSFQDTSDLRYIGMQRHFDSFLQAANEASISRVYGGIHYLNSVNAGADQGRRVAEFIIKKLEL